MTNNLSENYICKLGFSLEELAAAVEASVKSEIKAKALLISFQLVQKLKNLYPWQLDIRNNNPQRAGAIYREISIELEKSEDRINLACSYLKAFNSFKLATVELSEWQRDIVDNNPLRAALVYKELISYYENSGNKQEAALMYLACANAISLTNRSLTDWQIDARDKHSFRAGALYLQLVQEAEVNKNKELIANYQLSAASCFNYEDSKLTDWQIDIRNNNPLRAGALYRELALEYGEINNKEKQAEMYLKSANAFASASVSLAPWQIDARDHNPLRAGALYRELAISAQSSGHNRKAASFYTKAAECFISSNLNLSEWQIDLLNNGIPRALNLLRSELSKDDGLSGLHNKFNYLKLKSQILKNKEENANMIDDLIDLSDDFRVFGKRNNVNLVDKELDCLKFASDFWLRYDNRLV